MVSLDKCSGSYNVADEFSIKICFPSKTKDVNVKVFNMITKYYFYYHYYYYYYYYYY